MSNTLQQSLRGKPLPQSIRDLLSVPPRRGGGLHNWLFRAALVLHPFRTKEEIIEILRWSTYGEAVQAREIEEAVDNSSSVAWKPGEALHQRKNSAWSALDVEKRATVIAECSELSELLRAKPFTDDAPHTEEIIDALFPGDPLLCCGTSSRVFATRPRSDWRGELSALQLIVPSPMTAKFGETKGGKKSQHTLSNTGPRRFLVIEQDNGSIDEQMAILAHLAKVAPLALVVHSGGKSLHGWFFCQGRSEETLRRFMNYAVSIGADRATWTPLQFVRMPDGVREGGARQLVHYFNSEVVK
jgi:hypothetical protein